MTFVRFKRSSLNNLNGLFFLLFLGSCYVPDNFGAEIRINRDGGYGITYSGDLIWAPLFGQILRGELNQEAIVDQIDAFTADLRQDRRFTFVASRGQGRFQVRYERTGQISRTQVINFVRRNARIFELQAKKDGQVHFRGRGTSNLQAEQLENMGLFTRGLLRIVTDAPVHDHNATSVRQSQIPGYFIYDWRMTSFRQPEPKLTLQLSGELSTSPGQ